MESIFSNDSNLNGIKFKHKNSNNSNTCIYIIEEINSIISIIWMNSPSNFTNLIDNFSKENCVKYLNNGEWIIINEKDLPIEKSQSEELINHLIDINYVRYKRY